MLIRTVSVITLCFLIISCTSNNPTIQPSEESINKQENLLKKIYIGQDEKELGTILTLKNYPFFEVVEDGISYRYQNYHNIETNISLGVFFLEGKLVSIISEDDSQDLFSCRTPFKTNGNHWLKHGVRPYSEWIIEKNKLKDDFNYRAYKLITNTKKSKTHQNIEGVATLIAYSPLLVIGSPFILYAWATGEFEEDEKKGVELQSKFKFAQNVTIGTPTEELSIKLGLPTRSDTINGDLALSYYDTDHTFGVRDNKVIWIESPSMFELHSRQLQYGDSFYGNATCANLDKLWHLNASQDDL